MIHTMYQVLGVSKQFSFFQIRFLFWIRRPRIDGHIVISLPRTRHGVAEGGGDATRGRVELRGDFAKGASVYVVI